MKCLYAGHVYELADKDGNVEETQILRFSNREPGTHANGTTTQEVLRVLIDRTRYCNNCLPHPNNERIIYHMRMALVLHEARALERKVEKDGLRVEFVPTDKSGHFELGPSGMPVGERDLGEITTILKPWKPDWDRECDYPKREDKPKSFVHSNEIPEAPNFENEELWVYTGNGFYHRLIGKNRKWVDDTREGSIIYDQNDS